MERKNNDIINTKQIVANVDCEFHKKIKSHSIIIGKSMKEYVVDLIVDDFKRRGVFIYDEQYHKQQ